MRSSLVAAGFTCLLAVPTAGCSLVLHPAAAPLRAVLDGTWPVRPDAYDAPAEKVAPPSAETQTDDMKAAEARRLTEEGDAAWAARADAARVAEAIGRWKEAAQNQPAADTFRRLARAHHLAGDLALLGGDKDAALRAFDAGASAAERALGLSSPAFVRALRAGVPWEEAVTRVERDAVGDLYWYGANVARWARGRGFAVSFRAAPMVRACMKQVLAADPDYAGAAAHRYFGAYYALMPPFAGRDLDRSADHFHEALTRAPAALANRVAMADTLAVKRGDRALFERLLKGVLAADTSADADAPEQELEKRKAEALLARADRLF